jgi:catechol 2,3-dioxygenase
VPSLEAAHRLFVETIGLDVTASGYPGALFMSAGGYHHHVAANTWGGRNVPALPDDAAGLLGFRMVVPDAAAVDAVVARAAASGVSCARLAPDSAWHGVQLQHAGGIRVLITYPSA